MTKELYTAVEDRILWEWVDKNPQQGGGTAGNEIYKQLEKKARLQMTPRVALTDLQAASPAPLALMEEQMA